MTGEPNQSVAYFSEQAYACIELARGKPADRGMVKYGLLTAMQDISKRMGKVASLADVSVGIRLRSERLKVIEQPNHAQFVLYDVREDLAQEFLCENKLESAEPPSRALRSQALGKYVRAVFGLGKGDERGETVATLWEKEGGYWKLVSYEVDPDFRQNSVPNTAVSLPSADTAPLRHVDGDKAMIRAAGDLLDQWLVRRNLDKALTYIAPSAYACVNLYRSDDVKEPATPAEARALLRKGMARVAEAAKPAATLEDAIVAAEPHHLDLMLVTHDRESAFAIVSLPDYMAEAADCAHRKRGQEPDFEPAETGRNHGNYYAAGFSLRHTVEDPAVLWIVWGKERGAGRFDVNSNHFQLAMLAYNLNCWLMLFNREPQADATELRHTTLATSRLRFLFVAAKIWRHAGRTGVSYSDHYEEKGVFERLMNRLRRIAPRAQGYAPVMVSALR